MMRLATWIIALAVLGVLGACDDEPIQVGRPAPRRNVGPVPGSELGEPEVADAGPARRQYRDEDFVEADSNRDPFRNYAPSFQVRTIDAGLTSRDVDMPDTSVEEMVVIGIISGVADPRAMMVDREGVGHVVRRGRFIGRAEIVQAGGIEDLPVTLHWRVDRIRANEVVLTRDDPTAPNRPPLTRVIPLRDQDEELRITPR